MRFPRPDRFLVALAKLVWDLIRLRPVLVDPGVQADRISECERCDDFDPEARQCLSCTCFCDVKTWMAFEECPKKKWRKKILPCLLSRFKTPRSRL